MLKSRTDGSGNRSYMDQVQNVGSVDYVKDGQVISGASQESVLVSGQSDLAELSKAGYEPGTIAYTAGFKAMWQLDVSGLWVSL